MAALRVFENGVPKLSEGTTTPRILDEGVPAHAPAVLLEDGASYLLLEDGSYLLLE